MRVNGSVLGKCLNQRVSLIGTVEKLHPDSMGFDISTADNFNVHVKLQKPITQNVSGLVEVHGVSQGPTNIACDYYLVFPYNLISTYDAQIDNEAINIGFLLDNNPWKPNTRN